jgi:sugar phosphate isomerase/epimerase
MKTVQGPGLFLAQYVGADARLTSLAGLAAFARDLGFKAVQIPVAVPEVFDLARAAASQDYCDEVLGVLAEHGLALSELGAARIGQLMAVHPAYDRTLDGFAPAAVRGDPAGRTAWAVGQFDLLAAACRRLGVTRVVTFSGSLLWPYLYPFPPAPGLVRAGFAELARRWRPVLDGMAEAGVALCFELHPTEDLHDGATFERFLALVDDHPACRLNYDPSHLLLQHVDYLGFIDVYHPRIAAFHVKDAEFVRSARTGVYGGYLDWTERAGRFRSPGDGQVDFKGVFSRLTGHGFDGWATLEWECCLKNRYDGAREGAAFIADHIIRVTEEPFDAAMAVADDGLAAAVLGLR